MLLLHRMENELIFISTFKTESFRVHNHCGLKIMETYSFPTTFSEEVVLCELIVRYGYRGLSIYNQNWIDRDVQFEEIESMAYNIEMEILNKIVNINSSIEWQYLVETFKGVLRNPEELDHNKKNKKRKITRGKALCSIRRRAFVDKGIDLAEGMMTKGRKPYRLKSGEGMSVNLEL